MGLANWLTLLRILLIPVFVLLLVYRRPGVALLVFSLAAITDMLDGYVARRRGSQSRLGAFLDPLADKLLLMASFVTLDRKSTRLNSSHLGISYAVFCLKKKKHNIWARTRLLTCADSIQYTKRVRW